MQIEVCALCAEPALDWYRVVQNDLLRMSEEELIVPLCEPHRSWLESAGERGRLVRDGVRWRVAST